jgi:hypothetical protein
MKTRRIQDLYSPIKRSERQRLSLSKQIKGESPENHKLSKPKENNTKIKISSPRKNAGGQPKPNLKSQLKAIKS